MIRKATYETAAIDSEGYRWQTMTTNRYAQAIDNYLAILQDYGEGYTARLTQLGKYDRILANQPCYGTCANTQLSTTSNLW